MTRLTKKLSFEHKARKRQVGEKDIPTKFRVIKILKDNFNLIGLTGETFQIPGRAYHRMPDIYVPEIKTVIELDGLIHGNGETATKLSTDETRDEDYKQAGLKEIIIFAGLTDNYEQSKVIETLQQNGLVKIS